MKNCLVVLGMHRSGTSAFTGILDLLGVNLGSQMLETQPDNPKGFFENKYVVLANDCILDTLETSWDDTLPLPEEWTEHFAETQLLTDIRAFLRKDITEDQLSALKDPRLCKLLPLWLPLFAEEGINPHFALLIRHPLEIADSLQRRNGFSTEKSLILWMQHMIAAERSTRQLPRGMVTFEALLAETRISVTRVFESAGLKLPEPSENSAQELEQFLDSRMRHHQVADGDLDEKCPPVIAKYYRLLCSICTRDDATNQEFAQLDELAAEFERSQNFFYNRDVIEDKIAIEQNSSPDWYEQKLDRVKSEFERDKIYREYRYIANTRFLTNFLNSERPQLQQQVQHLDQVIREFVGSPPWRVYKKYQETVARFLPEGTLLRRILQQAKTRLTAHNDHGENAAVIPAEAPQQLAKGPATDAVSTPQWESLRFSQADQPAISIIIPVFNNWHFTYKCLQSLHQHTSGNYEVIVVDNNSTDVTPELLAAMEGIRVITNPSNEVFVNACNQAAAQAKGDYLLLLNNDTEVTSGWLEALIAPFSDPTTGIVGGKLVYPDGSLQEAGGIIWRDGTGCNFGHGDHPDLPQYSYRKAVDYCSGACLMITRKLWEEIGGFDKRYAPAYYEDTDLCFAVRARNYKVIYQPRAVVVHYGGASAGKETTSGYKRFQEINRHKFVEKWQAVLDRDHVFSSDGTGQAREKGGNRHILVIDHYVPTYDKDSGSQRMLSMLQILQDMDYKVSFWPDDLTYDVRYTTTLQDLGIETFYGQMDFEDYIREQGDTLNAVLMSRPATAKKYLHLVKQYSKAQTIFDTVDLHFVREQRRLELEVQQWKNLEFFLAEETDTTFVVSPTEKALLADESFANKVAVVSNIHSLEPCDKGYEQRNGLMFIGGFGHPPNEEGIIWFIEYVLPLIRQKIPDITLTIVGSDPTERIKALATDSIIVTGYVEDVSGLFNGSRVFVSPLLHGAGVKGKIGQSFSYGLPVVTTSIGAEGMQLTDGHNALITDSETEFARKVVELYTDKFLWQKLSTNCRDVIREQFSTDTIRAALSKVLGGEKPAPGSAASQARAVIVHCHLFKNAGSTLDWSLHRAFGPRFVDHRDDDSMRKGSAYLKPYLEEQTQLCALSSHHVRFPLPTAETFEILPIIALRHPVDRARSVYEFERRQDAQTAGALQAKKLSFVDYVRWRMQSDTGPTIRNFHCSFCTSTFEEEISESEYLDSVARLAATPMLVLVERYDESMLLLEDYLDEYFPAIDLAYISQNQTPDREGNLQERIDAVFQELGPELTLEFREKNHWDMKLYEDAQAILDERLGKLGKVDALLQNFRSRCQTLAAGE